jgi:hypothetical protein
MGVGGYEYDEDSVAVDGVYCVRETDRAILVTVGEEEVWVPKSQIHDDSEVFGSKEGLNNEGTLIVRAWLAEKNNWL